MRFRMVRMGALVAAGCCVFQTSGCTTLEFVEFIQTILLGITAAGSVAILRNI